MKDPRFPRRSPPTKEELLALQREREERFESAKFPWTSLVVAGVAVIVSIAVTGGGAISLMVATLSIVIVLGRRFKPRPKVK